MPLQVMDSDGRHAPGIRQAARQRRPGQQRPNQPGSSGVGDSAEGPRVSAGSSQSTPNQWQKLMNVVPRGQLPCEKAGIPTELRRREFYEKPTQERKRKKAAAIKRHMKRISRDGIRVAR